MREEQFRLPHKLTLTQRSALQMNGVSEVVGVDEQMVAVQTEQGLLTVHGDSLHLKSLTPEAGQVAIEGHITALVYEEPRKTGGFWSRFLR